MYDWLTDVALVGKRWFPAIALLVVAIVFLSGSAPPADQAPAQSQLVRSPFSDMMLLGDGVSAPIELGSDRRNHDFRQIKPGETLPLAKITGAGCIRHIYFSIAAGSGYQRDLVLRMYWDGETSPSVEVPFGDFFGQGHERECFFRSMMVVVNEGTLGRAGTLGFNAYFPMPFSSGARLELANEGNAVIPAAWYHIEYEKLSHVESDAGRFHAQWRMEKQTVPIGDDPNVVLHSGTNLDGKENYVILEAEGRGNFVGYFLNIDNHQGVWYGEGDDMIFIDGETWPPSFHGTGSEEIFGGGACPNIQYAGPYTGFYFIGNRDFAGKVSMYRFHVADPIRFQKKIRVTIEHGHANNMANDYASTAFWYQAEPHTPFAPLPPAKQRHPRLGDDPAEKAHQASLKMRQAIGRGRAFFAEKGMEEPPELVHDLLSIIQPQITKAFDEMDYATAIEKCQQWINRIEQEITGHQ